MSMCCSFRFASSLFALTAAAGLGAGCGDNNESEPTPDAPPAVDAGPQAVSIAFAAKVGGADFVCGQSYDGIGSGATTYTGVDFRFYVHDVRLTSASGDVPVTLDANDFQADGIALLDFETGGTGCQTGTTATHTAITGTVPPGSYTGIKFKVGVPFEKNHLDVATAAAPLNITAMYWAWASGYKFAKIDGSVMVQGAPQGFNLHVGSTGCNGSGMTPPTAPCANPNIIDVALPAYTLSDTITADVARVLTDVDVSVNTTNTAFGCMSFPNDPECNTVFPKLGLAYGGNAAGTQALFSVD